MASAKILHTYINICLLLPLAKKGLHNIWVTFQSYLDSPLIRSMYSIYPDLLHSISRTKYLTSMLSCVCDSLSFLS